MPVTPELYARYKAARKSYAERCGYAFPVNGMGLFWRRPAVPTPFTVEMAPRGWYLLLHELPETVRPFAQSVSFTVEVEYDFNSDTKTELENCGAVFKKQRERPHPWCVKTTHGWVYDTYKPTVPRGMSRGVAHEHIYNRRREASLAYARQVEDEQQDRCGWYVVRLSVFFDDTLIAYDTVGCTWLRHDNMQEDIVDTINGTDMLEMVLAALVEHVQNKVDPLAWLMEHIQQ